MENWGLVTYRETALLYDPAVSSTGNKERVVTVIAHELAHMVGKRSRGAGWSAPSRWFRLQPAPDDGCITRGASRPAGLQL